MTTATDQYGNYVTPTAPAVSAPFYAQGSATGNSGLFAGPMQGQPAVTQYVPGQGMAPYAANGMPAPSGAPLQSSIPSYGSAGYTQALNAAIQAAAPGGQSAIQRAVDSFNAQNYNQGSPTPAGGGTPYSAPAGTSPTTAHDGPLGIYGSVPAQTSFAPYKSPNDAGLGGGSLNDGPPGGNQSKTAVPAGLLNGQTNPATPGQLNIGGAPSGTAGAINDPGTPTFTNPANGAQPLAPQGGGSLQMQQQSPGQALSDYHNTAGYQNVNAPGAFQQSPGYQFATQDAMRQLQANASSEWIITIWFSAAGSN